MKNKKFIDGFILRFSMVLMAIFVCGFAFISCDPAMEMVEDVTQPTTPTTPEPTTPTTPETTTPTTPETTTPTTPETTTPPTSTEAGTTARPTPGTTEGDTTGQTTPGTTEGDTTGQTTPGMTEGEEDEDDGFGTDPNVDPQN